MAQIGRAVTNRHQEYKIYMFREQHGKHQALNFHVYNTEGQNATFYVDGGLMKWEDEEDAFSERVKRQIAEEAAQRFDEIEHAWEVINDPETDEDPNAFDIVLRIKG